MRKWAHVAWVFAANLFCILLLGLPIYLINLYANPHIRGFDPSQQANALPYKPDTVKPTVALVVSFATTLLPIVGIELFVKFYFNCESCVNPSAQKADVATRVRSTWIVWVAIGRLFAAFFAGVALTGVITDMIKYMVARPRPSFLHMCMPDYTKSYAPCHNCGNAASPGVFWPMCPECPYIPPDMSMVVCQQPDWWTARNMWLSFPSGHSSYTFFCGAFLAIYLFKRLAAFPIVIFSVVALRPLLVFASIVFSLYVALSRVSDDRHHVTDVMAGSAIGIIVGLFSAFCIAFPALRNIPNYLSMKYDCGKSKDIEAGNQASGPTSGAPFLSGDEDPKLMVSADKSRPEPVVPEQATPF